MFSMTSQPGRNRRWLLGLALALILPLTVAACGGSPQPTGTARPSGTAQSSAPDQSTGQLPTTRIALSTATAPTQTGASLAGEPDPTFGKDGKVTTDLGSTLDEVHGLVVQPDGKIVAAGVSWPDRHPQFSLVRYDEDGNLDPDFGDGGKVITNISSQERDYSQAFAIVMQPDGKLVVAGMTASSPDYYHAVFALTRYNTDGSLDDSFGKGGKVITNISKENNVSMDDEALAVALAPDGKIVAAGVTGIYPPDFAVTRYNTDGSLDESFGERGIVVTDISGDDDKAQAVAVQPDGKILVAGYASTQMGKEYNDYALVRYNMDGSLDKSFGKGGKVLTDFVHRQDWANAIVLRPDGKIVLGGPAEVDATLCGGYTCSVFGFSLAQYNSDGSLDTGFGQGGRVISRFQFSSGNYALLRLPNGMLVTGGHAGNDAFALAFYTPEGKLIESYGKKGLVTTQFGPYSDRVNALALQPDGKLVAAGVGVVDTLDITNNDFALARYR